MCFICSKQFHIKANCPLLSKEKFNKKKNVTWAMSDEMFTSESEEDCHDEKESLSCSIALNRRGNKANSNLDNSIDHFDMPSYDELS